MDIKQGAQANKNGKVVERMLEPLFEDSGFKVLSYSDASKNPDLIKTLDRYVLKTYLLPLSMVLKERLSLSFMKLRQKEASVLSLNIRPQLAVWTRNTLICCSMPFHNILKRKLFSSLMVAATSRAQDNG